MDLNELKRRLQSMNGGTKKQNDIWKPKDEHDVRLLPYPHGDDPLIELHFHYEIGDTASVLCPKLNFGDDCEICDFCDKLRSWKNADGADKAESDRKADWEIFKKIQPKVRVFIPMIERGKENEGAKFWGVTANQAMSLLEICSDGDRLAELNIDKDDAKGAMKVLFDTSKAFDLHVSFAKVGEKGNTKTFPQITFKGKIKATPVTKDAQELKKILDSVKKIADVYPRQTSAEVARIFKKFVGSSSAEATPDGGEEYNKKQDVPKTNTSENSKMAGTRSIDDAFGDMIKDA